MLTGSLKIFSEGDSLPEGLVRTIFHQLKKGGNMLPTDQVGKTNTSKCFLLACSRALHPLVPSATPTLQPHFVPSSFSLCSAALGLRHRHVDVISIYSPWSTPMLNGRVTKGEHKVTSLDFVEHSLKGRS